MLTQNSISMISRMHRLLDCLAQRGTESNTVCSKLLHTTQKLHY